MIDLVLAREKLNARKQELEAQSASTADDRATVELDQTTVGRLSRMDSLQQQAMAAAQERVRRNELTRIEQALRRLANDEYGFCVTCGEQMAPARLNADPAAAQCVRCADDR